MSARPGAAGMAGAVGLSLAAFGGLVLLLAMRGGLGPAESLLSVKIAAVVLILIGVGLLVVGLGIRVFGPVASGRAQEGAGSHRLILSATALAVLLAVLLSNLLPLTMLALGGAQDVRSPASFAAAALGMSTALLGVGYLRFIRPGLVSWQELGLDWARLRSPRAWRRALGVALLVSLAMLLVSNAIQEVLRWLGVQQTQLRDYTWILRLSPAELALVVFCGAGLAPLSEELFFRGIMFGSYIKSKGALVAYPLSALVFGLLHFNVEAFLPLMSMGLVLALVYRRTGTLLPGILSHGINNSFAFLALYFGWVTPPGG